MQTTWVDKEKISMQHIFIFSLLLSLEAMDISARTTDYLQTSIFSSLTSKSDLFLHGMMEPLF